MSQIKSFVSGEYITDFYLIKQLECRQTKGAAPKDYFDITLADMSGEISAKYWDVTPTDKETFFAMDIIKVEGQVQTYNDKLQFKITRLRKATPEDGYQVTDFIRSAPVQGVDLVYTIKQATESIHNEVWRTIIKHCINKVEDKLLHYPAAKGMHHNFYSGLAYHTCRMLELADFICMQRPFLNADLLKAGIILHDIAKTEELISELGIVSDYSFAGKLIGHISMACNWITEASIVNGYNLNDEGIIALQHMILSHHNLGEWGSPVQPQLPEAVALHYIDQIDAKLQAVEDALDTTPEGEKWTPPLRIVENKQIYRMG
jgi:3'-5' exoribonuclease